MLLRRSVILLSLAVVAVMFPGVPSAWAAPAQVGTVSFVGASTTSLKLSWPRARGATSYEVFRSAHKNMSGATRVKTTTSPTATVTGMATGKTYCFQVRAKAGSSVGMRSAHTCKPTIRAQSAIRGTAYGVMTLNACSSACSGWSRRQSAARKLISHRKPDVVAAQEAGAWTTPPSGFKNAFHKSAKRLFYRTSRFTAKRAGSITLSSGKYAVWAELADRGNGKRIMFASVHTSPAYKDYPLRGREITNLVNRMGQLNTGNRPVVYAGDFNSHKNRGTYSESAGFGAQDSVGRTFAGRGYYDAYDLARTLKRPNWNSYSGFKTKPTISKTWGDHVDHVYISPGKTNVYRWMNAALYSGSRYSTPIPSDHSAVQVNLYIP
jgi:endonuclease/exonuclease/phosphatase family metal-dependent hydrolase